MLSLSLTKFQDMKLLTYLTVSAFSATLFFAACKNDDAVRDAAVESIKAGQPAAGNATGGDAAAATSPTTPEPAQNAAGVWHYTCPKGCAGGGGSAVACATCGTTLAHNAAYHPPASTTTPPTNATSLPEGITPIPNPTQTAEPAQNAKGVWHFTCSSGCEGGAGSAVACAKCGKTLAHNQTYHL
jgi:hypothetical protein